MDSFKNRYKENVTARRRLVGSGGIDLVETSTQKVGVAKPIIFGSATSMVTPAVAELPKSSVSVAPADSKSKRVDGKKLSDFSDLIIDTGAPIGDAMIDIENLPTPVAPG